MSGVSDCTWENEHSVTVLSTFIVIIAGRDLNYWARMNKFCAKNIGVVAV